MRTWILHCLILQLRFGLAIAARVPFLGRMVRHHVLSSVRDTLASAGELYPLAGPMPPIVDRPWEDILTELDQVLRDKVPQVAAALQPGLTEDQIRQLETSHQIQLPEDLCVLYRWHNGLPFEHDLFRMYKFFSLEVMLQGREVERQSAARSNPLAQLLIDDFFRDRQTWLTVFTDVAGGNYFLDTARQPAEGAIFNHPYAAEELTFYSSLKNLISEIIECYKAGLYPTDWDSLQAPGRIQEYQRQCDEIEARYAVRVETWGNDK